MCAFEIIECYTHLAAAFSISYGCILYDSFARPMRLLQLSTSPHHHIPSFVCYEVVYPFLKLISVSSTTQQFEVTR